MTTAKASKDFEATTEQVTQLNERLVESTKKVGNLYLDSYEKLVDGVVTSQQKLADQAPIGTVKSVLETQLDLTRQVSTAYIPALRELIA